MNYVNSEWWNFVITLERCNYWDGNIPIQGGKILGFSNICISMSFYRENTEVKITLVYNETVKNKTLKYLDVEGHQFGHLME